MLVIGIWLWGSKYGPYYIERLRAGVARHLQQPHRFQVFTPEPEDEHLTRIKGCFARLRLFDVQWQTRQVDLARERGYWKVWCDARTENVRSIRCLERVGFRVVCGLERHWHGQDFVLMERWLEPRP